MMLKEKFKQLKITVFGCGDGNPCVISNNMLDNSADTCEQIADEFAIGFSEWISLKGYQSYSNGWANFNTKAVNEKELLEIYKKEKGL